MGDVQKGPMAPRTPCISLLPGAHAADGPVGLQEWLE